MTQWSAASPCHAQAAPLSLMSLSCSLSPPFTDFCFQVTPNYGLRAAVEAYREEHPWAWGDM